MRARKLLRGRNALMVSAVPSGVADMPTVRIAPSKGWSAPNLREAWYYRELLYFLIWRDTRVRYKQTIFGLAWAIIQPVFAMVVFSLVFGRLARIPSEGIPYPLFSFAALVPWGFFANGLSQATNSLVSSAQLLKKVYFPRLIIPVASVLGGLVDFVPAFVVLILMMLFYGFVPTANVVFVPLFLLLALVTSLGTGLWLSALNVRFRDVRHVMPLLVQLWLFATPVVYPSSLLPDSWRIAYGINPMVGVVEGFRWTLLGTPLASGPMILVSTGVALALLISGALYFRQMERMFADVV